MKKLKIKENVKTQQKVMSDFPGKNVGIFTTPPCEPFFFFVAKMFFSNFPKKCWIVFFNEIDCKKFSKFFSMNSTVKNFRKCFIAEFIEKNCENFK